MKNMNFQAISSAAMVKSNLYPGASSISLKTRGSAALDKAQRRLALLKGIDTKLDVGNGYTIESYSRLIEQARNHLEAHNTLLSEIDESRRVMAQLDAALSEKSEHMLRGVGIKYGKKSIEYAKAGGTIRGRRSQASTQFQTSLVAEPELVTTNHGSGQPTNGKVKQPALN